MRPMRLPPDSVNHNAPSGPGVIEFALGVTIVVGIVYSVNVWAVAEA